jgi:hypothetical protein
MVSTTPRPLYPREVPGTHCTGGWVASGPVWTCAKNLAPTGIRSPDRPARSQSLYRLSYPGPHDDWYKCETGSSHCSELNHSAVWYNCTDSLEKFSVPIINAEPLYFYGGGRGSGSQIFLVPRTHYKI